MERSRTVIARRRRPLALTPVAPTPQIIAGSVSAFIPFLIASYIFGSRLLKQRQCPECGGSGLVSRGERLLKCPQCGGWLPFQSWRQFFIPDPRS